MSRAWWHRVVVAVAASFDNNVESVDWDQAPGVTTMVLSIWHYYVISDQRHTMVSVSELRRRWLITMALSVHTPHRPGHAERWGAVTRYSQIHHQHRTQHPGISHPLTSHTDSDARIYLPFISNIISSRKPIFWLHFPCLKSNNDIFWGNSSHQSEMQIDSVTLLARFGESLVSLLRVSHRVRDQ